jgi:hypothetical protein
MRPSQEERQKAVYERTMRDARKQMEFVMWQYRHGREGAYIDDIGMDEATRILPIVRKALKTLGYKHKIKVSGACILIDFLE